jgi:glycosyltransferase involved in cell wall biosynthesis
VKVAHAVSSAVVTSLPSAYPYKRDKLHVIGQGIDPGAFAPTGEPLHQPPRILCAGRLSAVKDHPTLIGAVALLNRERPGTFAVAVVGSPARSDDEAYLAGLKQAVHEQELDDVVTFHGSVVRADLPGWYSRAAVHVNLTPAGFGDKVALEAMSCGTPCITANEDFRETLGQYADVLLFAPGNSAQLADRLRHVLSLSASSRAEMGTYLRERVIRLHSIEGLAARVLEIGRELSVHPRRSSDE